MPWVGGQDRRAVTPVVAVVLLVTVTVLLASVAGVFSFSTLGIHGPPAPQISVSHEFVEDGSERTLAVTMVGGEPVEIAHLYVLGKRDLDIGSEPGSPGEADEAFASRLEPFSEATDGNPPQIGVGETWETGETIYLDPVGKADGVTIGIFWSSQPVEEGDPSGARGRRSYKIAQFTV